MRIFATLLKGSLSKKLSNLLLASSLKKNVAKVVASSNNIAKSAFKNHVKHQSLLKVGKFVASPFLEKKKKNVAEVIVSSNKTAKLVLILTYTHHVNH